MPFEEALFGTAGPHASELSAYQSARASERVLDAYHHAQYDKYLDEEWGGGFYEGTADDLTRGIQRSFIENLQKLDNLTDDEKNAAVQLLRKQAAFLADRQAERSTGDRAVTRNQLVLNREDLERALNSIQSAHTSASSSSPIPSAPPQGEPDHAWDEQEPGEGTHHLFDNARGGGSSNPYGL